VGVEKGTSNPSAYMYLVLFVFFGLGMVGVGLKHYSEAGRRARDERERD
jgi:hypothetical protein